MLVIRRVHVEPEPSMFAGLAGHASSGRRSCTSRGS
eukprot:SAG11_NODE_17857_length_507_cov_0.879902_1_plen_35_part_10